LKPPITVAIVDDHPGMGESLKSFLIDEGFQVPVLERHGQTFIERLSGLDELPQVCVVDVNMPNINGAEVCRSLKQRYPKIKIIALTMSDSGSDRSSMFESGADIYLLKGSETELLVQAINKLIYN
jgi:DNA-binding NarL/FixJ family response regulator